MTDSPDPAPGSLPTPPRRTRLLDSGRLCGVLVVLCLVLAGGAAYAWYDARSAELVPARGPIASVETRDSGLRAVEELSRRVLSYDWRTLDADVRAARASMAPSFRGQYDQTMARIRTPTLENEVRVEASVVGSSVVSATRSRVVALVFVNQVTTAKGTGGRRTDQNRVLVTLTRGEGEWRVSTMDEV